MSDTLLPIMEPSYNLREICKQLVLLEDHLFHPRKRCPDCIRKHLLFAEGLAEEAVTLNPDALARESTAGLADQIRRLWTQFQDVAEFNDYEDIAQDVRALRKGLVEECYDVRVASWLDIASSELPDIHPKGACPYRVMVRSAGYFEVGDQVFFGKYKNKAGIVQRLFKDEHGVPRVEIQPQPQGRKKNRTMGLFNIWHADMAKRAGEVRQFPGPGGRKPPAPKKTITIGGEKYALSDDPGDFMRQMTPEEDDGEGAQLIQGPAHEEPYRFLWVYDTERRDVYMWRVTDGNHKVSGSDSELRSKIVELDRVGEMNRVTREQFQAIAREMDRRENETFRALQEFVDDNKDDFQRLVDQAAQDVFDDEIAPEIERRLDEVDNGVVPFGFQVNERLLDHHDEHEQMRQFVINRGMERYTVALIEDEVRRRGGNPDDPNVDVQAAYWAMHDVMSQAGDRFSKQASAIRVAAKYKDQIPGGLADKKKPSDFDADQLAKGVAVEMEHVDDETLAREIAMDHLVEDSAYYDKLETIEKHGAKYQKKKKVKTKDGDEMTVYEYSDRQVQNRNKAKAERVEKLRGSIGDLRKQVTKDLDAKDSETRLTALAVALIDETFERVGNDTSAEEGHFGVTGWTVEHISFSGGTATIKYVGKSGVDHEKKVTTAKVVSALKAAVKGKKKSDVILCDGDECTVTATEVNAYLKPFDVTAKDIRGLHANETMREELTKARKGKLPEDKKEREKQLKAEFKEALEATAEAVGHEASTLKSQYLVPGLEDTFLKDGTVIKSLKASDDTVDGWWAQHGVTATKTPAEKEDDHAESILRKPPKNKPPRKDLQTNLPPQEDNDSDAKQDEKDTSKNQKHMASVEDEWIRLAVANTPGGAKPAVPPAPTKPPVTPGPAKPKEKKKPKRQPGEVWETDKGWAGKSKDGNETKGGFDDEEAALAWVESEEEHPEDDEDDEDPKDPDDPEPKDNEADPENPDEDVDPSDPKAEALEAEAQANAKAVKKSESAMRQLVKSKHVPEEFHEAVNDRVVDMSDEERVAFANAFAEGMNELKSSPLSMSRARTALKVNPKAKHSPEDLGRMVAEALHAAKVTLNPFMIDGKKISDDTDPADGDPAEAQQERLKKAQAAKALYAKFTPDERQAMADRLGEGPPPRSDLDPNSPRAQEIDAVYYGMAMAAMLKGEDPPDLDGGWKDAQGISPVQPSSQMTLLTQAMARVGKEDLLLGTVEDFTAPESQKAVRTALKSLSDTEVHEFVKGGPLEPLAEGMLARDEKGKFILSEKDRKQFRQMIEDSVVEDIALLDPLVGEHLNETGQKNTAKTRQKVINDARQSAMAEHLENFRDSVKDTGNIVEGDNLDRDSTKDLKAQLAAAGTASRNGVINLVLKAEGPETDTKAVARAVRDEGSNKAMTVRRVRDVTDDQRKSGSVWGTEGEFYAKTPEGNVIGPFKNKARANAWAFGEDGAPPVPAALAGGQTLNPHRMASVLDLYDFQPWPDLSGSSA